MTHRSLVVGLGSNVGGRESLLRAACDLLARVEDVTLVARSQLYDTAPVGPAQPRYLNAAVLLRTALPLATVFEALVTIERSLARERTVRWGPRTLDLDDTRQTVRTALKAVTWHALEVGPLADGTWRAQVVVDV